MEHAILLQELSPLNPPVDGLVTRPPLAIDTGRIPALYEIADELWADHGDPDSVYNGLIERALEELPQPPSPFVLQLLELGARTQAQAARKRCAPVTRQRSPAPTPTQEAQQVGLRLDGWGSAIAASILDTYEIKPGLMLGDAWKSDLMEAADALDTAAKDTQARSKWLRLIAARVNNGGRVRQSLTAKTVDQLRLEARRAFDLPVT